MRRHQLLSTNRRRARYIHRPSHRLQGRVGDVVGRHDDVVRVGGAAPGEDRKRIGGGSILLVPLHQRPVAEVDEELDVGQNHLRGEEGREEVRREGGRRGG